MAPRRGRLLRAVLRRSVRAPPLPLPAAVGRPRPARPRQQRHLRRLPAGGAGRHAPHPRPDSRRRRPGRGRGRGAPRGHLRRPADLPLRAGRASSAGSPRSGRRRFTMAYEIFARGRRRASARVYLRARDRADAVRLRHRAAAPAARRGAGVAAAPTSSRTSPCAPPSPVEVARGPGGTYPVHVRFSDVDVYGHVNNVKYFEYLQEARIQLLAAAGRRELGDGCHLVVAQTDVDYRRPILFRPEPYDCRTWVSHVGRTLDGPRVRGRATATTCWPAPASWWSSRPDADRPGRRRRGRRERPSREAHSRVLTMNWAACVT